MWKKIRYVLYFTCLISVFAVSYKYRQYCYVPLICDYVNKTSDSKIQFSNFSLSFPFEISVYGLEYENKLFLNKTTLRFKWLMFIKNINRPLKALVGINIDKLTYIDQNGQTNYQLQKPLSPGQIFKIKKLLRLVHADIFIKNTEIFYKGKIIKASDTAISADGKLRLKTPVSFDNHNINLDGVFYFDGDFIKTKCDVEVFGNINSVFGVEGSYGLDDNFFEYKIDAKHLSFKRLKFGKSNTEIIKNEKGLTVVSNGDFGAMVYKSQDGSSGWYSKGNILLIDKAGIFSTRLNYTAKTENGILSVLMQAKDTTVLGNNAGTLNITAGNGGGVMNLNCCDDFNNNFNMIVKKDGQYTVDIYADKHKTGNLYGNYNTGQIFIDIKNVPVKKFAFLSSLAKKAKGTVSLYGSADSQTGSISLLAKNIASKNLKHFDVLGKITKEKSKWMFDVATRDKKLAAEGSFEFKKNYNVDFYYKGVDVKNIFKIFGLNPYVTGFADGHVKYNSQDFMHVDISLSKGYLFENKFDKWTVYGDISPSKINISTFTLKGKDVSADLSALVDFTQDGASSYLKCDVENFKIGALKIGTKALFEGSFDNVSKKIKGNLNLNKTKLGEFYFNHIVSTNVALSTKTLDANDIKDDNGMSGGLSYDFQTGNISLNLKTLKSDISKYFKELGGSLNCVFSVQGSVSKPVVNFTAAVKNGIYSSVGFDANAKIIIQDNIAALKNLKIVLAGAQKGVITASGIIDKNKTNVKFNFKNLTHEIINKYMEFKTPLKGVFYGDGTVSGKLSSLQYLIDCYADTMYIKTLKFHSLKSKIEVNKNIISLKEAVIKFVDAEINASQGIFDTQTNIYSIMFRAVNAHLGPFNIFGNINLKGQMNKKTNGSTYKGNIELSNFWINREKLDFLALSYVIADKKIKFTGDSQNGLHVSGAANFKLYPKMQFEKIIIKHNKQIFNLTGSLSSENLNFSFDGKSLDSQILADIFDLPFDMSGAVNFNLKAAGNISEPVISGNLNSAKGNIFNVPYDNFDIAVNIEKNMLDIKQFKINKAGSYTADISGSFPFWIDSSVKEKMAGKKVNINYEISDNKLSIINAVSGDNISAKKGNLKMSGILSGTRKKLSNTGSLSVSASDIVTNYYVHKIKDLEVDIKWKDNLFSVEKFAVKAGSGRADISGQVIFDAMRPSFYDLNLFTSKKGLPVIIHELPIPTSGIFKIEKSQTFANFSKGNPKFNFKLQGNREDLKLTGWAELENTRFCFPSPVDNKNSDSAIINDLFDKLYIDINLKSANSTNYENTFGNLLLKGGINLKGDIGDIKANGIVESDEGRISYMGNDFDVIKMKAEILNNELFISGEADTEIYTNRTGEAEIIKVIIERSNIKNIKTKFASKNDPTMESSKALARLTKTDPTRETVIDTSTDFLVKQQLVRLFGSNIATPLANTVLKKTGIIDNIRLGYINQDNLQVDSNEEPTLAELLYGMKYSVEKNINRLMLIGYSVTFDQIEREVDLKQAVEMSFKLNKDLFLKGSYGLQSDNPLYEPEKKLMLEQRLRFGGPSK